MGQHSCHLALSLCSVSPRDLKTHTVGPPAPYESSVSSGVFKSRQA